MTAKTTDKKTETQSNSDEDLFDPFALTRIMMEVSQKIQPLWHDLLSRYEFNMDELSQDPLKLQPAYSSFVEHLLADPQKLAEMQLEYWQEWSKLWQDTTMRFLTGEDANTEDDLGKDDRRFKSELWQQNPFFDFLKQSYLLTTATVHKAVRDTEGLDEDTRQRVDFYTRQYLNALSPSNFLLTNPEVLKETIESKGENLLRGFENLMEDIERGKGELNISTTDYDAFQLGQNIATTEGKVIYQNDLMQLIQYKAQTKTVHKTPLLIVPPWINKFYILDLRPEKSMIDWLVKQGHTVFTISWVNPDKRLSTKRFEDYMEEGVFEALSQIETITGEASCNTIGYCLGGTLLSVTLAWLAAKKQSSRIASTTLLTTMVDFEKSGEMKIFMDEAQLKLLDKQMSEKGFLPASHLKKSFSLLRANDMIWTFVVNNYLMGREPFPFDLLYWNDDSTNMPAAMHSFYMRKCYQENLLPVPGGVTMKGIKIDMGKVKTPAYVLSTKEDHIAPWQATYETTKLFNGPVTFTLSESGHVAGVVNPPDANKYGYYTNTRIYEDSTEWIGSAKNEKGSWWPHWQKWLKKYAGEKVEARKIGGGKLKPIEDAPGSYVQMKAD